MAHNIFRLARLSLLAALFVLAGSIALAQTQKPIEPPCRKSWNTHQVPEDVRVDDGSPEFAERLSLSTDGRQLVTTSRKDGTVKFWDVDSGDLLRRFEQEPALGKVKL